MPITPVESLSQVLQVRRLRNSCRAQLTNHNEYIGLIRQTRWYFGYYRRARVAHYRLYLLLSDARVPLGYGAARSQDDKLLITECVSTDHRGQGHGTAMLRHLIAIGREEGRELVAQIWSDNRASISMHEKAGFKLQSMESKGGRELATYVLRIPPATQSLD
jgi:GNAT superfamily N-acetyltransferase